MLPQIKVAYEGFLIKKMSSTYNIIIVHYKPCIRYNIMYQLTYSKNLSLIPAGTIFHRNGSRWFLVFLRVINTSVSMINLHAAAPEDTRKS